MRSGGDCVFWTRLPRLLSFCLPPCTEDVGESVAVFVLGLRSSTVALQTAARLAHGFFSTDHFLIGDITACGRFRWHCWKSSHILWARRVLTSSQ